MGTESYAPSTGFTSTTAHYLEQVRRSVPVVKSTLHHSGDRRVGDFLAQTVRTAEEAYQPRHDLWRALSEHTAPLLGASVAHRVVAELDQLPAVLTANHHGVDFFAQSVQGTLLFGLSRAEQGQTTVPVFAFGSIALNNLTYPRGLLIYGVTPQTIEAVPTKLPVLPSRLNRSMVSSIGPVGPEMIDKAAKSARDLRRHGVVSHKLGHAVEAILEGDYRSSPVLQQYSYARQAVVLNSRIWRRLFAEEAGLDLVYVEMERLVARVLETDLIDPKSLVSRVMFDRDAREHLIQSLEGTRGCWESDKLQRRLLYDVLGQEDRRTLGGCGTFFVWGVDEQGRRVPLWIDGSGERETLRGVTDSGERWEISFSAPTIAKGLREGTLLPSLFTCFLVTALARGVTCLGGYYQGQYLPEIQSGVASALEVSGADADAARLVRQVPTDAYLSGMQTILTRLDGHGLIPAGPAEIAAAGGLTRGDRQRMLDVTVGDAHAASLFDTVSDTSPDIMGTGWRHALASEAASLFADKVVTV